MTRLALEYQTSNDRARRRSRTVVATIVTTGIVICVNAALLLAAAADRRFNAFAIAVIIGPIINVGLLVVSIVCVPFVRGVGGRGIPGLFLGVGIGLPAAAIAFDFLAISSMRLSGC